jgi:hypothetical protein
MRGKTVPRAAHHRPASGTPLSRQRHTGPSIKESYKESSTCTDVPKVLGPLRASGILDTDGKMIMEREVLTFALMERLQRREKRFLRGPVPFDQLASAFRLSGSALAVLLVIHHQAALTAATAVRLPAGLLRDFGIGRSVKARALHALEGAGLIQIIQEQGRTVRVSLSSTR